MNTKEATNTGDLLEMAWGLIANANGGNWDLATAEWKRAAERWRDGYHEVLPDIITEEQNAPEGGA